MREWESHGNGFVLLMRILSEKLQYTEMENDNLKRSLRVERNIRKDFEESYLKLLQKVWFILAIVVAVV